MRKQYFKSVLLKSQLILSILVILFIVSSCNVTQPTSTSSTSTISPTTGQSATTTASNAPTTSQTAATVETTRPIPTPTQWTLLPPVETNPPNTNYKPAFAGQTRAPGIATSTLYSVTILSKDLKSPWAVTTLPDGRLIVTEKAGTLRIVTIDGRVSRYGVRH